MDRIILASASTGRKQLFNEYFKEFIVSVSDFNEKAVKEDEPAELTRLLALKKAASVAEKYTSDFVTGFDTVVVCEGRLIGKPSGREEACELLSFLGGRSQTVFSGYAVINRNRNVEISGTGETVLNFKILDENFISEYVMNHPVTMYAGGYAVQERDEFISIVKGSFENVIGAPMKELIECLVKSGLPHDILKKGGI